MSWDFYNVQIVKSTRKDHLCVCCSIKIHAGSGCVNHSGKCDGEFVSQYVCCHCNNLYNKYSYDLRDSESWDEIYEFLQEALIDEFCSKCEHYESVNRECNLLNDSPPMQKLRCAKERDQQKQ